MSAGGACDQPGRVRTTRPVGSHDELGPQLLLTHLEVIERDPTFRQVLVECGELLEQLRLVHVTGRR